MDKIPLSKDIISKIGTYLSGKPYIEVADIISKIQIEIDQHISELQEKSNSEIVKHDNI